MRPEDSLYIKVLLWAFDRKDAGFTLEELREAMNVNQSQWEWIEWMFTNALNGDSPLIWYRIVADGRRYYLTVSGSAAAIDYLELSEAQQSGKRATLIALVAITISIVTGLAQIYFDAFYKEPGSYTVEFRQSQ